MDNPDFIIVGGGSAGAVLASRLSEDPATRVLLIEAGSDTPPDAVPADIADTFPASSLNGDYFWPGLQAVRTAGGGLYPFPQARVMGGGSSVMGLWALRGMPADFDAWAAAGAEGWTWDDVRETYRRLENDSGRPRPNRGPGPMPIARVPRGEWPPLAEAVAAAAKERGLAQIDDINEQPGDGFFAMPLSQDDGGRASSARCYLGNEVRRRGNLALLTQARVTALKISGNRVTGVTVDGPNGAQTILAREVIVSAGAIHSPALLLRSGIGPAEALRKAGIAVAVDRAGVGQNLQNHVYLHFALTMPPSLRLAAHLRRFAIAGIRLSSREAGAPASDLLLFLIGRVSPRPFGTGLCMMGAALYSPFSRGQVTIDGPQAERPPRIEFNMLSDVRDRSRLVKAARQAESAVAGPRGGGDLFRCLPAAAGDGAQSVQPAGPCRRGDRGARQRRARCTAGVAASDYRPRHPPRTLAVQPQRQGHRQRRRNSFTPPPPWRMWRAPAPSAARTTQGPWSMPAAASMASRTCASSMPR